LNFSDSDIDKGLKVADLDSYLYEREATRTATTDDVSIDAAESTDQDDDDDKDVEMKTISFSASSLPSISTISLLLEHFGKVCGFCNPLPSTVIRNAAETANFVSCSEPVLAITDLHLVKNESARPPHATAFITDDKHEVSMDAMHRMGQDVHLSNEAIDYALNRITLEFKQTNCIVYCFTGNFWSQNMLCPLFGQKENIVRDVTDLDLFGSTGALICPVIEGFHSSLLLTRVQMGDNNVIQVDVYHMDSLGNNGGHDLETLRTKWSSFLQHEWTAGLGSHARRERDPLVVQFSKLEV
jgi:hypothetical protein